MLTFHKVSKNGTDSRLKMFLKNGEIQMVILSIKLELLSL